MLKHCVKRKGDLWPTVSLAETESFSAILTVWPAVLRTDAWPRYFYNYFLVTIKFKSVSQIQFYFSWILDRCQTL